MGIEQTGRGLHGRPRCSSRPGVSGPSAYLPPLLGAWRRRVPVGRPAAGNLGSLVERGWREAGPGAQGSALPPGGATEPKLGLAAAGANPSSSGQGFLQQGQGAGATSGPPMPDWPLCLKDDCLFTRWGVGDKHISSGDRATVESQQHLTLVYDLKHVPL